MTGCLGPLQSKLHLHGAQPNLQQMALQKRDLILLRSVREHIHLEIHYFITIVITIEENRK